VSLRRRKWTIHFDTGRIGEAERDACAVELDLTCIRSVATSESAAPSVDGRENVSAKEVRSYDAQKFTRSDDLGVLPKGGEVTPEGASRAAIETADSE
jgi:hypothetical protein